MANTSASLISQAEASDAPIAISPRTRTVTRTPGISFDEFHSCVENALLSPFALLSSPTTSSPPPTHQTPTKGLGLFSKLKKKVSTLSLRSTPSPSPQTERARSSSLPLIYIPSSPSPSPSQQGEFSLRSKKSSSLRRREISSPSPVSQDTEAELGSFDWDLDFENPRRAPQPPISDFMEDMGRFSFESAGSKCVDSRYIEVSFSLTFIFILAGQNTKQHSLFRLIIRLMRHPRAHLERKHAPRINMESLRNTSWR